MTHESSECTDLRPHVDLSQITVNNARNSPLLRLPAEVRNRIYGYTIQQMRITIIRTRMNPVESLTEYSPIPHSEPNDDSEPDEFKDQFTLASVCRELYAETYLLPYQTNLIEFTNS